MSDNPEKKQRKNVRKKADEIKEFRCKNLIVVIENPVDIRNIGTIVRNVNALGAEKTYIVDSRKALPEDWQEMREEKGLSRTSASAIKWSFVKRFDSTEDCLSHLEKNSFTSVATSPHVKGKENFELQEVDYTKITKLAVWFGNEQHGISEAAVESSKFCISIPMFGMIESLNLGTASGIVLYEVTKQRREFSKNKKEKSKLE